MEITLAVLAVLVVTVLVAAVVVQRRRRAGGVIGSDRVGNDRDRGAS